jgi:lysophospholipase L1-like esterase
VVIKQDHYFGGIMFTKFFAGLLALLATLTMVSHPSQASAADIPEVAIIGDSYTAGWTDSTRNQADAWWQYTARNLGWRVGNVVADPGGGYWTWGDYGTIYESVRDHPISPSTDFVLLQAGLNDSNSDPNMVVKSVADNLWLIKQQAPNATVIVIGMFVPGQQGMSPARLNIARRIGDWQAIGDTRYMISAMCTFQVSSDGTHPTKAGHKEIGDWVSWHIAHGLDNGKPLVFDGTSYVVG